MAKFRCIRKTYFKKRLYNPDNPKLRFYEGPEKKIPHFERIDDDEPEVVEVELHDTIGKALDALDHSDPEVWQFQGKPRVEVIEKMTGITVTRKDIENARPGLRKGFPQTTLKEVKVLEPMNKD